jgi:uncharacterized protein YjbI with pentapeptide repeats
MKIRQKMPEKVREEIKLYIKNKKDISDLIETYDLSNEYLSGAIIKKISRIQEKINNCNFVGCIFGEKGTILDFSGSDMRGCNFKSTRFEGAVWFRRCDLRGCNFNDAWMENVEYQYSDLRNVSICNAFIRLGSRSGAHAKFEWKQFVLLAKYLELDIIKESKEI